MQTVPHWEPWVSKYLISLTEYDWLATGTLAVHWGLLHSQSGRGTWHSTTPRQLNSCTPPSIFSICALNLYIISLGTHSVQFSSVPWLIWLLGWNEGQSAEILFYPYHMFSIDLTCITYSNFVPLFSFLRCEVHKCSTHGMKIYLNCRALGAVRIKSFNFRTYQIIDAVTNARWSLNGVMRGSPNSRLAIMLPAKHSNMDESQLDSGCLRWNEMTWAPATWAVTVAISAFYNQSCNLSLFCHSQHFTKRTNVHTDLIQKKLLFF